MSQLILLLQLILLIVSIILGIIVIYKFFIWRDKEKLKSDKKVWIAILKHSFKEFTHDSYRYRPNRETYISEAEYRYLNEKWKGHFEFRRR